MDIKEVQLYTNETVLELIRGYKHMLKKAERLTIIALSIMLLQSIVLVGGVLYFFSAYAVEVTDEVITQEVVGDNASINNVEGNNNTITTTIGGIE